jgi:predicted metal-dependent hydrolase
MTSPTPARLGKLLFWGEREIPYELSVEKRNDLAITVHPDLRVTVRAPEGKPLESVNERLQAKRSWIARQLRDFEQYHPLPTPRRFVGGETHWYLGRQYRLRLVSGPPSVRCSSGHLIVSLFRPGSPASVKKELNAWYDMRARVVFGERLAEVLHNVHKFRDLAPQLKIRQMEKRWGSCTSRGTVTLNTELVRASKMCIDYVLVHELCHLIVPAHSLRFFNLLDNCMPDWRRRRNRLNQVRG